MPIQFDNFDQKKIDNLKNHLVSQAEKGNSKHYEIFVDALKAVQKTDEPKDFDGYENYLTADTEQVKIVIYNTATSPRNDQFVFLLKARNREEATNLGLNGIPSKTFSRTSMSEWRETQNKKDALSLEIQALKRENNELKKELIEAEEHIGQLAEVIEEAKANGNKIGGIHLGDVLSVALEGMVRRNTHFISTIPAMSGLAGLIEKDNERAANETPTQASEVSFKKKEDNSTAQLSAEEQEFINLFKEIQKLFDENEIGQIIELLDELSKDKTKLPVLLELVQGNKAA